MGLLGAAALWGLDVMVEIYTVGHGFDAHFNPAATVTFASCRRMGWRDVGFSILSHPKYNKHEQERTKQHPKNTFKDVSSHILGCFIFRCQHIH